MNSDFNDLYEEYYAPIFNYVYYRVLNKACAEDIVGEVFLKAFRGLGAFDGKRARLSTWLFRIAANAVNDYFRTMKKGTTVPLDDVAVSWPDTACEDTILADDLQTLHGFLQKLDDRTRTVLVLRYWGECSYAEIARQTGLTEKNVSVILSRGISSLRKLFENL